MKPPTNQLDFPFTIENLMRLLVDGGSEQRNFTHYQIADWCLRMSNQFHDEDCEDSFDHGLSIAADVECQWDLYLANTYSLHELKDLDHDLVSIPLEWFVQWRLELTKTANKSCKATGDNVSS
jgi:hypothetical protein